MLFSRLTSLHLLICAAIAAPAAASSAQEPMLAKGGQAEAAIVIAPDASAFARWLAGELAGHLQKLSGADLPIVTADKLPAGKPLVVLGGPQANPLAAAADQKQLARFADLKLDGFVLKRIELDGVPVLLAGGNDEAATMYAVYELLERLGIVFQLTGDIIPQKKPDLPMPPVDVRMEPMLKYRGMHCCHGLRWYMGLDDFRRHIDQLAKLKTNTLQFYFGMGSPWLEFSVGGKTPEIIYSAESGYTAWTFAQSTTGTAAEVRVGRGVFPQDYLGPPEFADAKTQQDAYAIAREFLREVIRYAHQRKVQVWLLLGEIPYVPPSLVPPDQKPLHNMYCGQALPAGHPALLEIWQTAMETLIDTYPEADAFGVWTGEVSVSASDTATRRLLAEHAALRKLVPTNEELIEQGYSPNRPWFARDLDGDIAQALIACELLTRVQARHPEARLGVAMIFRNYLLRLMDAVLPKDVWLMNMENYYNTKSVMHFYGGIEGRELLAMPRIDCDGCELHMQLNAMMYDRDEIISGAAKYGLAGIVGQLNKERGLEANVRYIAEGAWNPEIDRRSFYEDYLSQLFGPDALNTLLDAFLLLGENDKALGWHGRSAIFTGYSRFSPVALPLRTAMVGEAQPTVDPALLERETGVATATQERWIELGAQYRKALELLRQARPKVLPGAQAELDYVIFKTESFAGYHDVLAAGHEAVAELNRALLAKLRGDAGQTLSHLEQSQTAIHRADDLAREVARQMIPYADIPTERYLLFRYNQNVIDWTERARAEIDTALQLEQTPRG